MFERVYLTVSVSDEADAVAFKPTGKAVAMTVPLSFLYGIDHIGNCLDILILIRWNLLHTLSVPANIMSFGHIFFSSWPIGNAHPLWRGLFSFVA